MSLRRASDCRVGYRGKSQDSGDPHNARRWKEKEIKRWEYKIINLRSENYRLDPAFTPQLDTLLTPTGEDFA